MLTAERYLSAFEEERQHEYEAITALEAELGYALDREKLEKAAHVLACPVKAHAPNWQHGRLLYAVARDYLQRWLAEVGLQTIPCTLLDIGTAKGFSALCLQWAVNDTPGRTEFDTGKDEWRVYSVDVIDPWARVQRNTIAECSGLKTLAEILAPWPEAQSISFERATGRMWLTNFPGRVHFAFIDGKHRYDEVSWEAAHLSIKQEQGDVIIFDDVQIPGVMKAVGELAGYTLEFLASTPDRRYAIARRQ